MVQVKTRVNEEFGEDIGGGSLVRWDQPRELIGTYMGSVEQEGQYGKSFKASMALDSGDVVSFFTPAALRSRLEHVHSGTRIRVVYDGTTRSSSNGRQVKNFTVQVAKSR